MDTDTYSFSQWQKLFKLLLTYRSWTQSVQVEGPPGCLAVSSCASSGLDTCTTDQERDLKYGGISVIAHIHSVMCGQQWMRESAMQEYLEYAMLMLHVIELNEHLWPSYDCMCSLFIYCVSASVEGDAKLKTLWATKERCTYFYLDHEYRPAGHQPWTLGQT